MKWGTPDIISGGVCLVQEICNMSRFLLIWMDRVNQIETTQLQSEMQKAASMASVLVLIFLPAVLMWCEVSEDLPTHKSC